MKKTYHQIKRIVVEELGFRDLAAYRRWLDEERPRTPPTPAAIDRLSPDVVDCRAFWKVCDELFGVDPVCNLVAAPEVGRLPHAVETPMDANRTNLRLAKSFAVTSFLEENAFSRLKMLEIGPGYGSLKNYVETHTNHTYFGVNAVVRVPGVTQATEEGLLPRDFVQRERGELTYVVSTNVFQHFSTKQRVRYVEDVQALLRVGGLFMVSINVDTGRLPPYARDAHGDAWAVHYGQYTPIPKGAAAYELLTDAFTILYVTQRYDGVFHFICQRT